LLTGLSLSYRELGQFEEARVYGRRSQAIYQELGDRYGEIQAALTLGELSRQLGECDEARHFCAQAVQLSQEIGHHSGEADGYYRLGQIAADQGEWGEALGQFRHALSLAHEIQERPIVLDALLEIGCVLVELNSRQLALAILGFLHDQPQTSAQRRARICAALDRLGDVAVRPVAGASLSEMVRLATMDPPAS
jgi:tetratricopeptide (TPR) repeat protein